MQITVGTLTRCAGQNHWHIPITIGGGSTFVLETDPSEVQLDDDDRRKAVIARLRSAAKEAGATTWPQFVAAVQGKTFQV